MDIGKPWKSRQKIGEEGRKVNQPRHGGEVRP
jgi:hypothetical protein